MVYVGSSNLLVSQNISIAKQYVIAPRTLSTELNSIVSMSYFLLR